MVRFVDYDTADMPASEEYEPPVASEHDRLLRQLAATGASGWAYTALVAVLAGVAADRTLKRIAVRDAWVESADTFCLVYLPPWAEQFVGLRRRRGDLSPDAKLIEYGRLPPDVDPAELDLIAPADPVEFAAGVLDDIGEPLGIHGRHLRVDADGLGWWGTLDEALPTRPARRSAGVR